MADAPAPVLLTGFEPFDGAAANPSIDAVRLVAEQWDRTEPLVTAELPVSYQRATEHLERLITDHEPALVVAVGLAGGRQEISLERLAVNLQDARIADNDGHRPADAPVIAGGPAARWTSLPVKRAHLALTEAKIPAGLSMTAGTFVCNALFYRLNAWAEEAGERRAGFVHVPSAEIMDVAVVARALRLVLETALDPAPDVPVPAGSAS
ncbi:pyroglutamyl-peptidase I [Ruania halotolerans]|uniref:pyroglutamyl-peptidase I family protein n=1 Tax=Ruania halotolerans TaxID=2897773 RepID=UPI001E2836C4|nr:pyroglutamyl-peptidase I [Ruania halotolerans]UFU08109.1 pyroglutamyl-peptidase I [Ruania halotolerans]